uniref:Protein O-glucosyltransferase 3 n=1 Tax=Sphenodon punctatus TaxID=8508 RepID=A0A8D0HM86_SPHPU
QGGPRPDPHAVAPRLLLLGAAVSLQPALFLGAAKPPPAPVSAERSLVWGPGRRAEITLPVKYFYIQVVSSAGHNFTRPPPGNTAFKVVIKPLSPKERIQIHVPKPLDRNNGSFLVRYRMYGSLKEGLKIEVLYGGAHVAQSPYILNGKFSVYYTSMHGPHQLHVQLLLRRGCMGEHTPVNHAVATHDLARSTSEKSAVLHVGFVGDWPVEHQKANDTPGPIPIISWCGSVDSADIVLPTYEITHSTLETLRGVKNDLLSIQGNTGKSKSTNPRGPLPHTPNHHCLPPPLEAQLLYKYQVNIDGTVAAYRFPYLLLGDSLVLKQTSQYYEHFYIEMKPWRHYVLVKRNLDDLLEKIKWAKENDEEARKIAKEGQSAARELLQPHRLYCYYYKVFQKYAERQDSKPERRDGMEFVPQPNDRASVCDCYRRKHLREDL